MEFFIWLSIVLGLIFIFFFFDNVVGGNSDTKQSSKNLCKDLPTNQSPKTVENLEELFSQNNIYEGGEYFLVHDYIKKHKDHLYQLIDESTVDSYYYSEYQKMQQIFNSSNNNHRNEIETLKQTIQKQSQQYNDLLKMYNGQPF